MLWSPWHFPSSSLSNVPNLCFNVSAKGSFQYLGFVVASQETCWWKHLLSPCFLSPHTDTVYKCRHALHMSSRLCQHNLHRFDISLHHSIKHLWEKWSTLGSFLSWWVVIGAFSTIFLVVLLTGSSRWMSRKWNSRQTGSIGVCL